MRRTLTLALLLTAPATAQWSTDHLSVPRWGSAAAGVAGRHFVAGGYKTLGTGGMVPYDVVDVFDVHSGTWSTAQLSVARAWLGGAATATHAVFAGGNTGAGYSDAVDVFDAAAGTWSTSALPAPRAYLVGAAAGGRVLFAGGTENGLPSDAVDIYDPATGAWTSATLSEPRAFLAATAAGDKAFFAGGTPLVGFSDRVDVYDAATDTWSAHQLSAPRSQLAATSVGRLVLFAGGLGPGYVPSDVVDIYDALTGSWTTRKLSQARWSLAAAAVGDRALFAGGWSAFGSVSDVVDVYDATTDTWSQTSLAEAREPAVGVAVENEVLFAGGRTACGTESCTPSDLVDRFEAQDGVSVCGPAFPHSGGLSARALAIGSRIAGKPLGLLARDLPANQLGYFLVSDKAGSSIPPGSQGRLCLGGAIGRFRGPGQIQSSGPGGRFQIEVDTSALPYSPPVAVQPGETWRFQAWFRDVNPMQTSNFTDAVEVTFV